MSKLFDFSSLAMIPSAYKDGKLYSIRPTDGSGDFTFSRGSNLAATRVDVNGLIEKGRENLVLYSNDFTNAAWVKFYTGVTDGQQDPFGGTNGTRLVSTGIGGYIYQNGVCIANNRMTASFWVKSNTGVNQDFVFTANGGNQSSSAITATTSWQRVSFTFSSSSNGDILFGYQTTQLVDLLIYGFQLELGLVATDYIETGASTAQAGILEDMPRLDYSASCPSLLLEPQRANLITHSEYLANYPVNRGSVSSNVATSPEGVQNAASLVPTTDNGDHTIQSTNSLSATTYTISCFAKNNGNDISLTLAYNSSNWTGCIFDLVNGEAKTPQQRGSQSVCTADIESYGDGWYRCSITATLWTAYAGWLTFVSLVNDADGSLGSSWGRQSFVGVPSETAYLYGLEIEQGSYPTSYIPTYGTSQTRSRDFMNEQISGLTSLEQGTFFLDFDRGLTTATTRDASADGFNYRSTSSFPSNTAIEIATDIGGAVRLALRLGSFNGIYSDNTLSRYKMLVKWSGSEVKAYVNGSLEYSSSVKWGDALAPLQYIGYNATFRKSVNQLLTFPTALTDSECIALTTL